MSEKWVERGPIPGPLHETALQNSCAGKAAGRNCDRYLHPQRRKWPDHAADGASGCPRRIFPLGRRDRGSRVHPHEDGGAGRGVDAHAGCNMRSPAASAMARWSPIFGLPSIVAAIGTMSLFRRTASILGDQAYNRYPASLAYFGQGDVISVVYFRVGPVCRRGGRLRLRAALYELRSADFRNWRQSGRCTLLGGQRRTDKVPTLLLDGSHVGRRGGTHHIAPRFYAALHRPGLRTRRHHHGRLGGCQHSRRGGPFPASCSRLASWVW
jgi:hypothetical protein